MKEVKSLIRSKFENNNKIRLEYLELATGSDLSLLETVSDKAILLIAGYIGEVRLIDNLMIFD